MADQENQEAPTPLEWYYSLTKAEKKKVCGLQGPMWFEGLTERQQAKTMRRIIIKQNSMTDSNFRRFNTDGTLAPR